MISIVCVTKGRPRAARFIAYMRELADKLDAELVIGCDAGEKVMEHLHPYADQLIQVESKGYLESVLNEVTAHATGDWVLRLDDDETCSKAMEDWLLDKGWELYPEETIFTFPTAWLWGDANHFITSTPLWNDKHPRFTTKEMAMGWQDFPHAGNPNGLGTYIPVLHLHHKFLEKNYPLRLQIAQAYEEHKDGAGFGVHMPFTLPEHAYTSVTVREVGEGHSPANPSDWSYTGEVIQLGDYNKVAYLVLGPESSGTRMLTEGIIRGGVWGQAGHNQQIDRKADFADLPEKIVYRKSLPHGKKWPDLVKITKRMLSAGYKVVPVFIQRDPKYAVKSQVRSSHVKSEAEGTANIKRAFDEISHLAMNAPVQVIYVHYGAFVEQEHIRRKLFEMLNLDYPETMLWYNANKRYEDGS